MAPTFIAHHAEMQRVIRKIVLKGVVRGQRRDAASITAEWMRPPRWSGRKAVSRALLVFDKQT